MDKQHTAKETESYFPISRYYLERFGEKVYKISVSIAGGCPNRQGDPREEGCIFCDSWGSAAYHLESDKSLVEQIRVNREKIALRRSAKKFLVYFQAYTNTYDDLSVLRERFQIALSEDNVCGIVLGTRPDCLPDNLFPLLKEFHEKSYVQVEVGVQSFFDTDLRFLNRGHTAAQSIEAVQKLHTLAGVDVGVHLIFGLPAESRESIIKTAEIVNSLPIGNVKLHNLHVLKGTKLAELYQAGEYKVLSLENYAERVIVFLQHLSRRVAVQRLSAVAARWDDLLAPAWTKEKMRPTQFIEKTMQARGARQGDSLS